MAENKEELSIEEMFDRLDGVCGRWRDSRSMEESLRRMEAGNTSGATVEKDY